MTKRQDLLPIAIQVVEQAADLMRNRLPEQLTAKGDRDYTSNVDYEIEHRVRTFLTQATPGIGFLGEEEGHTGNGALHWALDPIDGTINFANALPLCAVSLALIEEGNPVLGVIELPFLGRRYTATHTGGAFCGGGPIHTATPARLGDAIVSVGDYAVGQDAEAKNADRLAVTEHLAGQALRIRMFGSAAIDLAWVAEGITGAAVILSNKPWDTAAGAVIAREAGAHVIDVDGSPHTTSSKAIIAAAPTIAHELLDLVREALQP